VPFEAFRSKFALTAESAGGASCIFCPDQFAEFTNRYSLELGSDPSVQLFQRLEDSRERVIEALRGGTASGLAVLTMSRPGGQVAGGSGGKVITRRPGPKGATAVLDSSVGKKDTSRSLVVSTTASPTKSLVIKSPPKPSILMRTRFTITGKVQGVFFRKFTQQKAVELSIFGFVENHEDGSVVGEAEGRLDKMVDFKYWLEHKGSPKSKIESAVFVDESPVDSRKHSKFDVVR